MAVVRWHFFDPETSDDYELEVNPNEGGTPGRNRRYTYKATAGGRTLVYQAEEEPKKYSISGAILTEAQLDSFNDWFDKERQIRITDDLGRQFWVVFESFQPRRQKTVTAPWRHTYTLEATVIG